MPVGTGKPKGDEIRPTATTVDEIAELRRQHAEELAELQRRLSASDSRAANAETKNADYEQAQKLGNTEIAAHRVKVRNFTYEDGTKVDRTKPAWEIRATDKTPDGVEIPKDGYLDVTMYEGNKNVGTVRVRFVNGLYVTNDQNVAMMCGRIGVVTTVVKVDWN